MKICNVCGSNLEDGVNVCPICGNNLIGAPGQQPGGQPQQSSGLQYNSQPQQTGGMQYNNQPNQSQQSYGQPGGQQYGAQGGQPYGQPGGQQYGPQGGQPYGQPGSQQYGAQGGQQYGSQGGQPYGQPQQPPKKSGFPVWAIILIVLGVSIPVLAILAAIIAPAAIRYNKKVKEAKEGTTSAFEITTEDFTSEITEVDDLIEDIDDAFSDITEEATEETTEETTEAEAADTYIMPEMDGTVFRSHTFNYDLDFSEGNWVFSDVDERASMAGQDVSKINTESAVQESMKEDGFFYYTLVALNNEETVGFCAYDGFTRSTPAKVDDEGFIKQLEDELMSSGDMSFISMDTKKMTIDGEEHVVLYGTALQNGTELKIEMYYYVNGDYCSFIYVIGDDFDKMEQYMETL